MEVKPGYKQTEVGVIPEEWEMKSIRDFANIKTGPFGTLLKADEYSGSDGVPLISVGEVGAGRFRITEHTPLVPEKVVRRLPQYVLRAGDIVFGRKGAVDRSALVTQAEDGWFLGSDGISIRPTAKCHPPYLAAQFQRYEIQSWLLHNAIGTTMASLNQGILSRVQIPYAPLPEQRAIAEALSDVDELLGGLDRLIAKQRDLKHAAMQQLLTGQIRLPGFKGEWVVKELGMLGKISGAGVDKKIHPGEPRVRLVNYMDVYRRSFIYSNELDHVVSAPVDQAARCAVREGDVFFTPSSEMPFDIAASAVAMEDIPDACYSYHVVRLRLDEDWDMTFRAYAFKTQAFLDQASRTCEGSGVRYVITQGKFRQLTVRYPTDRAEQTAIAEVLTEMDAELAALEQRREKTRALKQAMMQELLTGRIRLV